jgi:hypothetical protein
VLDGRHTLTVCLEAWAVLAWLDGEEPAHDRIEQLLSDRPLMSWVNAVEVYCRVKRVTGGKKTEPTRGFEPRTTALPWIAREVLLWA